MKKIKFIIMLALALVFAFCLASCSDDSEGAGNNPGNTNTGSSALLCKACKSGEYTAKVTTDAGVLTDGERTFTCNKCSDSYSVTIPATKSAKILFIGDNSTLSEITYLEPILLEAGVENTVISTLNHNHAKGASIESQLKNISTKKTIYTVTTFTGGEVNYEYSKSFDEGLTSADWDFIVIGQATTLGGDAESYAGLTDYVNHIREVVTNKSAKLIWNMGWSLRADSALEDFSKYENDGEKMYSQIADATLTFVASCDKINGIIPVGTAIQNLKLTPLGDTWTNDLISLGGSSGDGGAYAASLLIASEILSLGIDDLKYAPEANDSRTKNIYSMSKEAAKLAKENSFEATAPECKTMKLLIMGNSYGNDAMAYFEKILHDAGYINVIIGHMGESSMAINDHYHNIDDDPTNDYIYKSTGNTFSVHYKTVNGEKVVLEADYKKIVADEDWDIITFYQGPNSMDTLVKESYYSELNNLCRAIRENMTNPNGKILYYMPWVHGENDTPGYYAQLSALTKKLFVGNELIDGIIPAGTTIQNLRTSYLSAKTDGTGDINRDWGHLNYGVGRYSVALTFFAYITGGDINDITYIPTKEEIASRPFTDIEPNLALIREAVTNAINSPFEITNSTFTEKP